MQHCDGKHWFLVFMWMFYWYSSCISIFFETKHIHCSFLLRNGSRNTTKSSRRWCSLKTFQIQIRLSFTRCVGTSFVYRGSTQQPSASKTSTAIPVPDTIKMQTDVPHPYPNSSQLFYWKEMDLHNARKVVVKLWITGVDMTERTATTLSWNVEITRKLAWMLLKLYHHYLLFFQILIIAATTAKLMPSVTSLSNIGNNDQSN